MKEQQKKIDGWMDEIVISKHFIDRYIERVDGSLKSKKLDSITIKNHINSLMNNREKQNIEYFKKALKVKLPFNGYQIVLKNKSFITIY